MTARLRKLVAWVALIVPLAVCVGLMYAERCGILPNSAAMKSAANRSDWQTIMRMIRRRPSMANSSDGHGQPLIHLAVAARRTDVVIFLAEHGAEMNAWSFGLLPSRLNVCWTPLIHAIELRDAEMVECLLKNGADPNEYAEIYLGPTPSYGKQTMYPLSHAQSLGLQDMATLLKKYGAKAPPAAIAPATSTTTNAGP